MTPAPALWQARQRWLATLAQAPVELLKEHARQWLHRPHETLREAQTGLVMLRARVGGQGDRFNLSEATVTRCVLRCPGTPEPTVGVGYVLGRDAERAHAVALFDALLQQPILFDRLQQEVLEPLAVAIVTRRDVAAARTATSRVRFATLQPEAAR